MFYDKHLSVNNTISCASCHKQALAFADNVPFSRGYDNRLTERNSMPIQNIQAFAKIAGLGPDDLIFPGGTTKLFWDGRETDLNSMVLRPLVNHVEMGIRDLEQLAEKLEGIEYYQELFKSRTGKTDITPQDISWHLADFIGQISSGSTDFDRFRFGNQNIFNAQEVKGWVLFNEKYECNACHQVQVPNGYEFAGTFANIGLDGIYKDPGLGAITENPEDIGKFKIPSLRNVALTAPYMHDGRFESLSEVIDHYASSIANHPNLDHRLKNHNNEPLRLEITNDEKDAIIAFLNTLTDHHMITSPDLSNPFQRNN